MPKITPLRVSLALTLVWPLLSLTTLGTYQVNGQTYFEYWYMIVYMFICAFFMHEVITPHHDFRERSLPPQDKMQ